MATYYLKADSEQALWEALQSVGLARKEFDPEDELNQRPLDLALGEVETWEPTGAYEWKSNTIWLDIIGEVYQKTGATVTTDDGDEYPEFAAIEGFHANLKARLTDEQEALLPLLDATPKTPMHKWAGDE